MNQSFFFFLLFLPLWGASNCSRSSATLTNEVSQEAKNDSSPYSGNQNASSNALFSLERFSCSISNENGLSVFCRDVDIEEVAKHLPKDIRHLEIRDSNYQILRMPWFSQLNQMESLTLYNNSHRFITSKAFLGLNNLRFLNLSCNNIVVIKNAFINTPLLETLDLSQNRIINIGTIATAISICNLVNLSHLDLSHNPSITKIFRSDLEPFKDIKLRKLDLYNSTLRHIDSGAFSLLNHLEFLDLSVNYLGEEALRNVTIGLGDSSVKSLILRKLLNLNSFPMDALALLQNTSVETLDLGYNHFPLLPELPSIPSVQRLWLPFCSIKVIAPNAFRNLPDLQSLELPYNQIALIDDTISSIPNLKSLTLSSQRLQRKQHFNIGPFAFKKLKHLKHLDLSDTNLGGHIYIGIFVPMSKLVALSLLRTSTAVIDDLSFETLKSLEVLDLQANSISYISNLTFQGLSNLKFLKLAYNRIQFTATYPFDKTPLLLSLQLQGNRIEKIPGKMFSRIYNLKNLYLFANSLMPWDNTLFADNASLAVLNLARNQITHTTSAMMRDFSQITQYLDLSSNPFNCSLCELGMLQQFMEVSNISFVANDTGAQSAEYICASPKSKERYAIKDVDFSELPCQPVSAFTFSLSILIFVFCFFVPLTATAWLCYTWRWYMRYVIFRCSAGIKERRNSKSKTKQYIYDAFVSYNSADTPWILSHLIPALEEQEPRFKLCIHERDFEVGKLISDNILEAIDVSRKVVLVLSDDFLRSEWCMLELHMAQHLLFDDTRDALVMVKLKTIDRKKYSKTLKYLEKTRTCLMWSDDPVGQKLFWIKMRNALQG